MLINEVDQIFEIIKKNNYRLIGLHGAPKAGKSNLAKVLSQQLKCNIIGLDDYLPIKLKGRYPDFIDFNKLKDDINYFLQFEPILIIEGICLLEILVKINLNPDLKIYIKNNYENFWTNNDIDEDRLNCIISKIEKYHKNQPSTDTEDLEISNAKYHCIYKPVANSDIVYEWKRSN